jgi:hypothetical protein
MTESEARDILKPPLKFGDERQIAANLFLERVEQCVGAILACENAGRRDHFVDICRCTEGIYTFDVVTAAITRLKRVATRARII